MRKHFTTTLSADQETALTRLEAFLASSTNCFLLKGYAGTGKTFLLEGLVKYFQAERRQFQLMAPTGRAAMIIGNKTGHGASTVHRAIYNMKEIEDDVHTFKFRYKVKINEDSVNAVYIVDEASMVADVNNEDEFFQFGSGHLLQDLFQYVDFRYRTNAKVIFVGDNAQLPPVGMNFSPALDLEYLSTKYNVSAETYEMTNVQRQGPQSGILRIATGMRSSLASGQFNRLEIPESPEVKIVDGLDFSNTYFSKVNNAIDGNTIVVAHSNRQVKNYNDLIRDRFFPGQVHLQTGEVLMNTRNNYNYAVEIYNGQFLKVLQVADLPETPKPVSYIRRGGGVAEATFVFRDIVVQLKDVKGERHTVQCKIIENYLQNDQPRLTQTEQQALYVDFKMRHADLKPGSPEFKDALRKDKYFNALQVKYGYAITCHKAQGGEWKNAFVDFDTHMGMMKPGFFRWGYTGITRARENLFVVNARNHSPLSEFLLLSIGKIENVLPNRFYVPESFYESATPMAFDKPFLKAKYLEIVQKFKDQGIASSVVHQQYQERYTFTRGEQSVIVNLIYGENGFSGKTKIHQQSDAEFGQFVLEKLGEPLIFDLEYQPPSEHQKALFEMLSEASEETGIRLTNIVNEQYCDRVFLHTEASCAYLDCWYNDLGFYSKIKPCSTEGAQDAKLAMFIQQLT